MTTKEAVEMYEAAIFVATESQRKDARIAELQKATKPVTDNELRAALVALMWAVRALRPSRDDCKRASLNAAMDRARRALREDAQATKGDA